jgi:DNA-binding NtrC family response regulator
MATAPAGPVDDLGGYVSAGPAPADTSSPPAAAMSTIDESPETLAIPVGISIDEAEKLLIMRTLELNQGNKPKTAEILGISLKTLYNKLERYELKV